MKGRLWLAAAGALALCALAAPAPAQEGAVELGPVQRSGDELTFSVVAAGKPALSESDLSITVNDSTPDSITVRKRSEAAPRGVVLVFDAGSSMKPFIAEAREAAFGFVHPLARHDQIALVVFSDDAVVRSKFTANTGRVAAQIAELVPSGGSALYDGLLKAVGLVRDRPPSQRNVVVLSSAADSGSNAGVAEAVNAAIAAGASVSGLAVTGSGYDPEALRGLAEATGGELLQTADASALPGLFEELARRLVGGYTVTVTNPDPEAIVYDIEVEVAPPNGGRASRVARFGLDAGASAPPYSPIESPFESLPLPIVMAVVFVTTGLLVFVLSEWIRVRRLSPAHRLRWYDQPTSTDFDAEALINAAVLKRAKELATRLADRTGYLHGIERSIESAGMRWRPGEVIVASVGLALAAGALLWSVGGASWGVVGALAGGLGPTIRIRRRAAQRRQAFYEQLSDVLLLMSGALRAGYSLQQAVATVGEDAKPPASEEFRRTMAEVRLGASLDDALEALARRIGIVDLEWSVLAIQIQREVGGNLAEILETISETIRERERLRRQLRTLTAEGRLSGWVLGLLPFAIGGFLFLRSPDYLAPLYQTSTGLVMVSVSAVLMLTGILWMRKIVRVEV